MATASFASFASRGAAQTAHEHLAAVEAWNSAGLQQCLSFPDASLDLLSTDSRLRFEACLYRAHLE